MHCWSASRCLYLLIKEGQGASRGYGPSLFEGKVVLINLKNSIESVGIARRSISISHEGSQQRCDSNGNTFPSKRDSFINVFFD